MYLGLFPGQGKDALIKAKAQAIFDFPSPTSKRVLMRFLDMAGYYRKFCKNSFTVVYPLTDLLKKNVSFTWSDDCQQAFDKVKAMLITEPVFAAPCFNKPFKRRRYRSCVSSK